jgi:hypothetical protein
VTQILRIRHQAESGLSKVICGRKYDNILRLGKCVLRNLDRSLDCQEGKVVHASSYKLHEHRLVHW